MNLLMPVNFVYLGPGGEEVPEKPFQARCSALPRVGEVIMSGGGRSRVVITEVYYKPGQSTDFPGELTLVPPVVLEEVGAALPFHAAIAYRGRAATKGGMQPAPE
jgi:hypothetical protein